MEPQKKTIQLPQAPESEAAVLGSVMISQGDALKKINHIITHKDFYEKRNQYIYRAMEYLYKNQQDIDVLTLSDVLRNRGYLEFIGGPSFLVDLSNDVPTAAHVVTHAKIVADRSTLRNIIRAAQDIMVLTQNPDEDLDAVLGKAEDRIKGVTRSSARIEDRLGVVDVDEWRKIARETNPAEGHVRGISTGYKGLDDMLEGMEAGEMIVLTGHTKHGKSRLATNIAVNVAHVGRKVMFVNTEMTKLQMGRRVNGIVGDEELAGKIILNNQAGLDQRDVIALMEKAKEIGCDLVIVDHLHFFSRSVDNQTNELSKITKDFKDAAVMFEIPLLLLAHVSQEDTKRVPSLKALKGSSSIAQDADAVITVWMDDRPNGDNSYTDVVRLAHRSASNTIRKIRLYNDGMRLTETAPEMTAKQQEERQRQYQDTQRRLGEKDDDDDLTLEGFGNDDLSLLADFGMDGGNRKTVPQAQSV